MIYDTGLSISYVDLVNKETGEIKLGRPLGQDNRVLIFEKQERIQIKTRLDKGWRTVWTHVYLFSFDLAENWLILCDNLSTLPVSNG